MLLRVYPVGIPAMYSVMLWQQRATLRDTGAMAREDANGNPKTGHLDFLVAAYKTEFYW